MTQGEFEKLVAEALDELPEKFHKLMDNVVVVAEEVPRSVIGSVEIKRHQILLGLYEGVPRTRRGPGYTNVPPDKITIFKNSIVALGQTPEGVKKLVTETVRHEVGHHFGLSDEAIHRAEKNNHKI
jgi:predicted Zn-dependent protease with MMP-like domain